MHTGWRNTKSSLRAKAFLEEVAPKLSSQEDRKNIVGRRNMSEAPRHVVGQQLADEQW